MLIEVYWKEQHTADIIINGDKTVEYFKLTNEPMKAPFAFNYPTYEQVMNFIKTRCVTQARDNIAEYLESLGLEQYDPIEIIKKTHGAMAHDFMWFKIDNEEITWKEVAIRE